MEKSITELNLSDLEAVVGGLGSDIASVMAGHRQPPRTPPKDPNGGRENLPMQPPRGSMNGSMNA